MLTLLTTPCTKLRTPTYPVNAVFPLSWLKTSVTLKAAGSRAVFTAPIHYPSVPEASKQIIPKQDVVEQGSSCDIPKKDVEPIIESWLAFSRAWSFNAPWWGGSVADLTLAVEIVKPKRLKESADLLSYPALKYAVEEYIEANYHHTYIDNERIIQYDGPEQWKISHCKNSPYISIAMLSKDGHKRHTLNFIPLDSEKFLCFGFYLYRGSRAIGAQEIEKQIPAAPMVKLINDIMSSVEIQRKGVDDPDSDFSEDRFVKEANANLLASSDSGSFSLIAS